MDDLLSQSGPCANEVWKSKIGDLQSKRDVDGREERRQGRREGRVQIVIDGRANTKSLDKALCTYTPLVDEISAVDADTIEKKNSKARNTLTTRSSSF